ncbi:MAG TPA: hypothetical protein QGF95_05525 [Candidatus Latescibacteria bacterium]|jgi:hypothetical protein|nr:hypothetical protein [Candidatus Latescibacterota bacterium]HJP29997.1 hypothetical protein [Candidatus Latescibacterota bacterium]|tara:strand:+ start:439 stop:768 length:330 start_codon:yes stop_codon:yes gene_type:complete
MTQTPLPAPLTDSWSVLEDHCATALSTSRDLLTRLEAGAAADDIVPLLQREYEAVAGVREQIARFGGRLPANSAERRDEVAGHLAELMRLDEISRDLMSRRGVRLRTRA